MACNKNVQELDSEKVAKAGDTMTGVLAFIAGTASAPGIAASGDTNTGIYFPAADTIGFSTGGSERLRVTSDGDLMLNNGGTVRLELLSRDALGVAIIGTDTAHALVFRTGNSEAARLTNSTRNLLIGTTTDDSTNKLQVNGNGIRISTSLTPASAGATGTAGTFAWDSTYFYICTATNTWQRVQHATW